MHALLCTLALLVPAPDGVTTATIFAGEDYTYTWQEEGGFYQLSLPGDNVVTAIDNDGKWEIHAGNGAVVEQLDLPSNHHPFYSDAWTSFLSYYGWTSGTGFVTGAPSGWTYGGEGYDGAYTWNGSSWVGAGGGGGGPSSLADIGVVEIVSELLGEFGLKVGAVLFGAVCVGGAILLGWELFSWAKALP